MFNKLSKNFLSRSTRASRGRLVPYCRHHEFWSPCQASSLSKVCRSVLLNPDFYGYDVILYSNPHTAKLWNRLTGKFNMVIFLSTTYFIRHVQFLFSRIHVLNVITWGLVVKSSHLHRVGGVGQQGVFHPARVLIFG